MNPHVSSSRAHLASNTPLAIALRSILQLPLLTEFSLDCFMNTACHSGAFHLSAHGETLAFLTLLSGEEMPEINIAAKSFSTRITPAHPDYNLILSHLQLLLEEAGGGANGTIPVGPN
jgi:hypothetical protein